MSKAQRVYHTKQVWHGGIVEMVVWRLPESESERPHDYKYRLVYVRDGERLVGYDNERGKGDHRHYGTTEEAYRFTDVDTLIRDFLNDLRRLA
ncbi:MAG: DUF6516 family protein [Chromatiaceae bacterium]|nr:DUF6516 family protein [Chromatiaceae bacterium]